MTFARIAAAAHAVPEQVVTNDDLSRLMDTSDDWIQSRTGIRERRLSRDEQTSDLAVRVARQLLTESGATADSLDFIIVATMTADSGMPSTAARVAGEIGAGRAFAYDLSAACTGFIFALATADKLISSGAYARGLVIGSEVMSKIIDWTDRRTAVLFGDGAGGVLLDNAGRQPMILAEKLQTDGCRGCALTAELTSLATPFSTELSADRFLKMDGQAIFKFATHEVPVNIAATVSLSSLTADEIDYFLLHQANSRLLDTIAKKLGQPREKFLQNLERYGNTSAASIPLLLSESLKNGTIMCGQNQKIVLTGFGGGLTWGTLVVNI